MVNAEEYLLEIPMWTKQKNSLEDVRAYLEAMGNPDRALKAVHVAGTNGKGSVCAFLTCALKEAGYRTGTFVSPHLEQVRERFLINGEMTDRESFERSFSTVLAVTERMVEQGKCHPTFFEFLFYMAMVLFREKQVDVVVLETGMGGRLDTTNVIESPDVYKRQGQISPGRRMKLCAKMILQNLFCLLYTSDYHQPLTVALNL